MCFVVSQQLCSAASGAQSCREIFSHYCQGFRWGYAGTGEGALAAAAGGMTLSGGSHSQCSPRAGQLRCSSARHTPATSDDGRSHSCSESHTPSSSGSSSGSDWDSRESSEAGQVPSGSRAAAAAGAGSCDSGALTAVALELLDLSVENVDVIEPHSLRIQVCAARMVPCPAAGAFLLQCLRGRHPFCWRSAVVTKAV